jgi:hypothetical protein
MVLLLHSCTVWGADKSGSPVISDASIKGLPPPDNKYTVFPPTLVTGGYAHIYVIDSIFPSATEQVNFPLSFHSIQYHL